MFILKWYSVVILSIILIVSLGQEMETDKRVTIGLMFIPILVYILLT